VDTVLSVRDLYVSFVTEFGVVDAVKGVSFDLHRKEILGLIGESGSGKTTTALAVLSLLPPYARVKGQVRFFGNEPIDVLSLSESQLYSYRWAKVSIVFQGAMNALNPVLTIRDHFVETAKAHGISDPKKIKELSYELLKSVELEPARVLRSFPFELSGGMKQRVMIALALVLRPSVIILDEPTTALDTLTQRSILELIKNVRDQFETSMLLITHDLSVIADSADRVLVLYNGVPMEMAEVKSLYYRPLNPYTRMLIDSFPMIGKILKEKGKMLKPASLHGCPFAPNCPLATADCYGATMVMKEVEKDHFSSCIHADQIVQEENSDE